MISAIFDVVITPSISPPHTQSKIMYQRKITAADLKEHQKLIHVWQKRAPEDYIPEILRPAWKNKGIPPPPKSIYTWSAPEVGPDAAPKDIIEVFNANLHEEVMYERAVNTVVNARAPFLVWILSRCKWGTNIPVTMHPRSVQKLYHGRRRTRLPIFYMRRVIGFLQCNNWEIYCALWMAKVYAPFYDNDSFSLL